MMNKFICFLLLHISIMPVFAGLYDDILGTDETFASTQQIYISELERLKSLPDSQIYNAPAQIHYGYNASGEYVPVSIGEQRIHYGYNAWGEFVPMSIGD